VSDLIIGLSVIALGTSLPELAVSISSVLKKQYEMVVGNVIGSNLFNSIYLRYAQFSSFYMNTVAE
jgi:cation:H+ antiporter